MRVSAVRVVPAGPATIETLVGWLTDPAIYQDAFWLAARPDPAWIRHSMLVVRNGGRAELQAVRIWSVHHPVPAGADADPLVGVAIDYGWDRADDSVREIDVALPAPGERGPRVALLTFAALLHRLFDEHGVTEAVARVRAGASGAGFPRLFASIGTRAVKTALELHPLTGRRVARLEYRCTPASFYASPVGRRLRPG